MVTCCDPQTTPAGCIEGESAIRVGRCPRDLLGVPYELLIPETPAVIAKLKLRSRNRKVRGRILYDARYLRPTAACQERRGRHQTSEQGHWQVFALSPQVCNRLMVTEPSGKQTLAAFSPYDPAIVPVRLIV